MSPTMRGLDLFRAVGTDRHLSVHEVPADKHTPYSLLRIWDTYARYFGCFTGSRTDPLFRRLDNGIGKAGEIVLPAGDAVLVVGIGPSLQAGLGEIARLRDRLHVITSPRGAGALKRAGLTPDLILIEHATALDAELSVRQETNVEFCDSSADSIWIAAEDRTPAQQIQFLDRDRIFIPDPFPTWGLWPASAVALALQAGARSVGLLGVDLGLASVDPIFRPLAETLSLLSRVSPTLCFDCGSSGAAKSGWPRASMETLAPRVKSGTFEVRTRLRPSGSELLQNAARLLVTIGPLLAEAREGLRDALAARSPEAPQDRRDLMIHRVERIMSWKEDPQLRQELQEGLGLSFLPQFWRSDIQLNDGRRLWRPVVLALQELVAQAELLESRLGDQRSIQSNARQ